MQTLQARFAILATLAFTCVAATCDGPLPVDVDADEGDRFTPAGRVAYEFFPGNARRRRGSLLELATGEGSFAGSDDARRRPSVEPVLAIVGEFAHVEGSDSVAVPVGERLDFDGDLDGAATADVRVKNDRGYLAARGGVRIVDALSIEGLAGFGLQQTDVRVRSGSFLRRESPLRASVLLGVRGTLRPVPLVDLYGQVSALLFPMVSTDIEIGAQLNVTRNVGIYGGYRVWTFEQESFEGASDADFEFRGPSAGVSLTF